MSEVSTNFAAFGLSHIRSYCLLGFFLCLGLCGGGGWKERLPSMHSCHCILLQGWVPRTSEFQTSRSQVKYPENEENS